MTDYVKPTRTKQPLHVPLQDEVGRRQQHKKSQSADTDRVSLGAGEEVGKTYGPGLKAGSPYDMLRRLVIKTFQEQGIDLQVSRGEEPIDFRTLTQEEAQELVSEEGYFGVEKTSQRIVDFAINAFGNDPAKLEQMKDAVGKGFVDAQEAFGGALPEISQQTYNAIMEKLDAFAAQADEAGE